jgi:hypothetical protein
MTVKQNQSTLDLSTQINGDLRSLVDFCLQNNFSITEEIAAGTELVDVNTNYKKPLIADFFLASETELATAKDSLTDADQVGIGSMIIGSNFYVY